MLGLSPSDVGVALRNAGVGYGDNIWNSVVTPQLNSLLDSRSRGDFGYDKYLIAGLVLPLVVGRESSPAELDVIIPFILERGGALSAWMRYKPYLFLDVAERLLERGDYRSKLVALGLLKEISKTPADLKRYRQLIISAGEGDPENYHLQMHVNRALAAHGENSHDPAAIDYLVNKFKAELARTKGRFDSQIYLYLSALLESESRFARRVLTEFISDPESDERLVIRTLRSFCRQGVIDERLEPLIRGYRAAETVDQIRKLFAEGVYPTVEIIRLMKEGMTIADLREMYQQNRQIHRFSYRLSHDPMAAFEYAFSPRHTSYTNVFSFRDYLHLVKDYRENVIGTNEGTVSLIEGQWVKSLGGDSEAIAKARAIYQEGIPDRVVDVKVDQEREFSRRRERLSGQIEGFRGPVEKIILLDNLLGRIESLDKRRGRIEGELPLFPLALETMEKFIGAGAQAFSDYDEAYEVLVGAYKEAMAVASGITGDKPAAEIDAVELRKTDEVKLRAELGSWDSPETSSLWLEKSIKKLRLAEKRIRKYMGDTSKSRFGSLVVDFQAALEKASESRERLVSGLRSVNSVAGRYRIHFVPKNDIITFMRLGDARESCVATNGSNSWSIPGYLRNEGTGGLIVIDEATGIACGHTMWHLREDEEGGVGPIVNGIYLDGDIPSDVADACVEFICDFSATAGLVEPVIAISSFSDVEPVGWAAAEAKFKVLQGVRVIRQYGDENGDNLYYDFEPAFDKYSVQKVLKRLH